MVWDFCFCSIFFCRVLDKWVSEVMEANVLLDACIFQQLSVNPRHGVRTPVSACPRRWEQDGIIGVLFMLLHQKVYRLLRQRHLADGVEGVRVGVKLLQELEELL